MELFYIFTDLTIRPPSPVSHFRKVKGQDADGAAVGQHLTFEGEEIIKKEGTAHKERFPLDYPRYIEGSSKV